MVPTSSLARSKILLFFRVYSLQTPPPLLGGFSHALLQPAPSRRPTRFPTYSPTIQTSSGRRSMDCYISDQRGAQRGRVSGPKSSPMAGRSREARRQLIWSSSSRKLCVCKPRFLSSPCPSLPSSKQNVLQNVRPTKTVFVCYS